MIVNAILYLLRTGCSWRQLPADFPPWQACDRYFVSWRTAGTVDRLHELFRERLRAVDGRDERPSAGVINAQSVRGAAIVGAESRGFDAGKKTNGRKRHVVVDTLGLLLVVMVTAASVQDRDALTRLRAGLPRRWVVERTLSWITICRQLACDYERIIEHSEAMVKWALIALMARRLARLQTGAETAYNW